MLLICDDFSPFPGTDHMHEKSHTFACFDYFSSDERLLLSATLLSAIEVIHSDQRGPIAENVVNLCKNHSIQQRGS